MTCLSLKIILTWRSHYSRVHNQYAYKYIIRTICSNSRGEIQAELSTAKELNENEVKNIKNELSNTFGSNIKLNHKHDPSLIGGLIIKVGSTMIDTSIKNKLQQIEKKMIEA